MTGVQTCALPICAGEVAIEHFLEVQPAVDALLRKAVEPSPCRSLEHEGDVAHGDTLVAACDVDRRDVVGEPVLRLRGAVVLGGVPWEREPLRESLTPDAWSEAVMGGDVFFLDDADMSVCAAFGPQWSQALVDGDLVADSLLGASSGSRLMSVAAFGSPSRLPALISRL